MAATIIATIGLGSCVAIALYDRETRTGGLAHILLPSDVDVARHVEPREVPRDDRPDHARGDAQARRDVDGAHLRQDRRRREHVRSARQRPGINVGERNIVATREALAAAKIQLVAEDTGLDYGRSVYFHLSDGRVEVRSLKKGDRVL